MNDQARALLMVGALLCGASGSAGFVGGRVTAPVPPAEVRFVHVPEPAAPAVPDDVRVAPAAVAPVESAPAITPPGAAASPADVKPTAAPRPKVEARPAPPKQEKAVAKKLRAAPIRQRRPTSDECAQMRSAGRTVVNAGGRLRGYSADQIDRAWRDCGF